MEIFYFILTFVIGAVIGYFFANGKLRAMKTRAEMLENQLNETKKQHEKDINDQFENLKDQFTVISESVLKTRTKDLSDQNEEQLSKILNPLQDRIRDMKETIEKNQSEQQTATASLRQFVETTRDEAKELGKTTKDLVNALSHDNKFQGGFGEMQLRKLLENMGLEHGVHFDEQFTIRNEQGDSVKHEETGRRMQPDVILHFPDNRDIIIDAKTSMTAFLRYKDETLSDLEHQQALEDHITAIKNQVKDLAKKNYWQQYNKKGIKLDFVVMFVPSESAMQLAITEEPALWPEAFEQGVFISGPQNLHALLKLLEISWKQKAQMENQQNIINCAEDIVKRVQMFKERYEEVKGTLGDVVQNGFHGLDTILADSGHSIITSARNLLEYGAKEDKKHKSIKSSEGSPLLEAGSADEEEAEEYIQEDNDEE